MNETNDPFLNSLHDALHDTPMQRKLRRLAPMPVGVVFLPWPGMTEKEARSHFRLMKELGFTCLKQTMSTPEWPSQRTLALALEEGIIPFWYAEGGWEDITPELLTKLGLPPKMDIDEAMAHPAMIAHQNAILRKRIFSQHSAQHVADANESEKKPKEWVPGVVGDVKGYELHPGAVPHFMEWLQEKYGTPQAVAESWNALHVGISASASEWKTWEDVQNGFATFSSGEYRHLRDIMRFRSDTFARQYLRTKVEKQKILDPEEPVRAGGEMGLFLPFASRGTDMEAIAKEMAEGGSFYPSIHMAWHFEEVQFEVARPVYMQAQIAHDWAKGIWSATWESTGGPQYFSGGKSPFVEETRNTTPGFTIDAGTMTQLMLSYIAAGFRGFGLWAWNARTAGWEAGEYALLDRNRKPTPRTVRAGLIGKAARKWRRELWQAHKEPLVGILADWDNEAMWAAMAVTGRDKYKGESIRARIGASRAFIDAGVPWEYVTPANLQAGLGPRYRVIYMPASIAITAELQQMLTEYVSQGGRVVLDMPGAYYDGHGRIFPTDEGSWFEGFFGSVLHEFIYGNSINTPFSIQGMPLDGFSAALTPTSAAVTSTFDDGRPAVTENRVGQGSAVLIAAQVSLNCRLPGQASQQDFLVTHALGSYRPPYSCVGALAYRLAAPGADHYFLINDAPAGQAQLNTGSFAYAGWEDAVSGESLIMGQPVHLEAHSGRWLRMRKQK